MEIVGGGGGGVKLGSRSLGDFLRIKEEDRHNSTYQSASSNGDGGRGKPSSGRTLLALLTESSGSSLPADEPRPSARPSRTLLDVIRADQVSGLSEDRSDGGRRLENLREKIRLRRGGASSWSDVPIQASGDNHQRQVVVMARQHSTPSNSNARSGESLQAGANSAPDGRNSVDSISRRNPSRETETASERFEQTSSPLRNRLVSEDNNRNHHVNEQEEERSRDAAREEEAAAAGENGAAEQPARTSLMALLVENDRQMGVGRSAYFVCEEEEEEVIDGGAGYTRCCVCMVRHKGAAFIPCGHTFCRMCSRELWVRRGNCPLCNNYILEILDIF